MKKKTKRLVHRYAYCLQIGTCQEHLPAAEQQWYLPSASVETELCAAADFVFQYPLSKSRVQCGTLCSKEYGGTGV